jgi:hypothetical protein
VVPARNDAAGDFMSENERRRMTGRNTAVREADVGVTKSAPCHLDDYFVRRRGELAKLVELDGAS